MDPEANSFSKEAELLGSFLWFLLSTTLKVWRSCLARCRICQTGRNLSCNLWKRAAPTIAALKLWCCPWRGTLATLKMLHWSSSPRPKILLSMTGCNLHYISVLKKWNCVVHMCRWIELSFTSCHTVSSLPRSLSSKPPGNCCLSTPRVCCADGETIGRGQFPHRHEDPSWIQMMCNIDPLTRMEYSLEALPCQKNTGNKIS